jgi:hypothetical protein
MHVRFIVLKACGCLPVVAQSHRFRPVQDSCLNRVNSDLCGRLKPESLSNGATATTKSLPLNPRASSFTLIAKGFTDEIARLYLPATLLFSGPKSRR